MGNSVAVGRDEGFFDDDATERVTDKDDRACEGVCCSAKVVEIGHEFRCVLVHHVCRCWAEQAAGRGIVSESEDANVGDVVGEEVFWPEGQGFGGRRAGRPGPVGASS